MRDAAEEPGAAIKPFVEHLDDLRRAVIWSAMFIMGGILLAIPLAPWILEWLRIPYLRAGLEDVVSLRVVQVGGGLAILMRIVLWSGLLFSFPFVVLSAGSFIFPGLSRKEKRAILKGGGFSLALFILGVWMSCLWTVPVALRMMSWIENWMGTPAEFWETAGYVSFVLKLLLAFGGAFQFPVIVMLLGMVGIINSRQLREKRNHVIVGLMVLSMLMTPPDPFTMLLMGIPLVALYEICIWVIWAREKRNGA